MTELGIVGDADPFVVNPAGTIAALQQAGVVVDWWVGAEDRWHRASSDAAVRQGLSDDGSTIETRLRIPGGDAVQRVVAVPARGSGVALVEIENQSPIPVALAMVLSSVDGEVHVVDDTVAVGGRPLVRAGRSIARVLVARDEVEALTQTVAGSALPPGECTWPENGSAVVAIVPLPHAATVRFVLGHGALESLPTPGELPPVEAVTRGWASHLDGAMQMSVPDARLTVAVGAARRHLLSGSFQDPSSPFWRADTEPWVPAVAAAALDAWGHRVAGRELLLAASGVDDLAVHATRPVAEAGALLWAWAERIERHPEPDLEAALGPWVEQVAIGLLSRRRRLTRRPDRSDDDAWRAVGLASAASIMARQGEDSLGLDIIDALPALIAEIDPRPEALALALGHHRLDMPAPSMWLTISRLFGAGRGDDLGSLAAAAGPTGAYGWGTRTQHPGASALLLLGVRRALVDEPSGAGGPVNVLGAPDHAWLGSAVDVHHAPIAGGEMAFGVRWHGDRPAVLWDASTPRSTVTVESSALDPGWSGEGARGEALLAPTPGLDVRAGPESARVRRRETREVETEPDSFG